MPRRRRMYSLPQIALLARKPSRGGADAETDAHVLVAAERADRAQAVVAGVAAAHLHPHLGRCEIELVVEGDDLVERDLVEAGRRRDGHAGLVHVSLRLQQQHLVAADLAFGRLAVEALAPGREAIAIVDRIDDPEADVVAVAGVTRPRIA